MEEKFREFFKDKRYIKIKNHMFNYLNRKFWIRKLYDRYKFSSEKILDIGSGISPVSPEPKKTLFIDISPEAVHFLNSIGYKAKVGSITKINEKAKSFEIILCSEVLEHVKNYNSALKEMYRVLVDGGFLILTIPVHMKYWDIDDEFVEHYRRFEPDEFKKELVNSGFSIIEEKPIGSLIERKLTILTVKLFKKTKQAKISNIKANLLIAINLCLYLIIRSSLLFTSKKSTSIMMYVCKKDI
ncbi:class I SAM-dependent methyltransferase [Candidatus Pacearchaeota archaeon]|nr:class I SAM-dependent methyltransferase [Candidatus Pacearchaeota archaeon]